MAARRRAAPRSRRRAPQRRARQRRACRRASPAAEGAPPRPPCSPMRHRWALAPRQPRQVPPRPHRPVLAGAARWRRLQQQRRRAALSTAPRRLRPCSACPSPLRWLAVRWPVRSQQRPPAPPRAACLQPKLRGRRPSPTGAFRPALQCRARTAAPQRRRGPLREAALQRGGLRPCLPRSLRVPGRGRARFRQGVRPQLQPVLLRAREQRLRQRPRPPTVRRRQRRHPSRSPAAAWRHGSRGCRSSPERARCRWRTSGAGHARCRTRPRCCPCNRACKPAAQCRSCCISSA